MYELDNISSVKKGVREKGVMKDGRFWTEQKKLEKLVSEFFESDRFNMGTDSIILKQSRIVDQLMADEMLLSEEECVG